MALLEFSVTPLGAGASVGRYVAKAVEVVEQSGLDYRLHAMGTVVEGELVELVDLLRRATEAVLAECDRVSVSAKLDVRKGHAGALDSKVASVERHLGHKLKT
jgi:uncharacterized protein (TIGR00106 family)